MPPAAAVVLAILLILSAIASVPRLIIALQQPLSNAVKSETKRGPPCIFPQFWADARNRKAGLDRFNTVISPRCRATL